MLRPSTKTVAQMWPRGGDWQSTPKRNVIQDRRPKKKCLQDGQPSAIQDGRPKKKCLPRWMTKKKKKKVPSKTDDQVPSKKDDPKKKCLPRRTTKKQEQNKRCSEKICWCLRGLGPNSMLDTYFGIMNLFDTYFWSHLLTALDPPISI